MSAPVLIIKLGALGDVIMATGLIRCIQQQHQQQEVFLLTSHDYGPLFQGWPNLTVKTTKRKGLLNMLSLLRWLRDKNFQRLYDLQSNDRTSVICALSGVPERIGNHPRFPYHIHPDTAYTGQTHIYERMLQVLQAAGLNTRDCLPTLSCSEKERQKVAAWLQQHNINEKPFVIFHAGASPAHPLKRWPFYKDLAEQLDNLGFTVVWVGGPNDYDLNQNLGGTTAINAAGLFSLTELAELGRHAAFAVCNDSAPMHVLACSNIPVFALFGVTNWRRNHAVGQQEYVIAADKTSQVFIKTPLETLTTDQVLQQLKQAGVL